MADQTFTFQIKVDSETGALSVLGEQLGKVSEQAKKTETSFGGLSKEAQGLMKSVLPFATAGGIVSFFTNAVKEAEASNEAFRRLSATLEANGISWQKNAEQVKGWAQAVQASTRFSDDQAIETLTRMARATTSLTEAQKASQVAMNLSVATGKPLAETTETIALLMQGNERAVMGANREYGTLAGNGKTAQEVLTNLANATKNAAENEDSFTKTLEQFNNAASDFSKTVGEAMIPGLTIMIQWLQKGFDWVQKLGTVFATNAAILATIIKNLAIAMSQAVKGHFLEAAETVRSISSQVVGIVQESAMQIEAIDEKSSANKAKTLSKDLNLHAAKGSKEVELETQQAAKIAQLHAEMENKLAAMGQQTLAKKLKALDAEYQANRRKIIAEIKDEQEKVKLLSELDSLYQAQQNEFTRIDLEMKQEAALETVDLSLQTLNIVNEMGKKDNDAQVNRAKAILALEKAIAIARILSQPTSLVPGVGQAVAAAQIALIVAQFAQQSKAIDQARDSYQSGSQSFSVDTTPLSGSGGSSSSLVTLGGGGGGSLPIQGGVGRGGAAGVSGGGDINIGGINIVVNLETLDTNAARKILDSLARELRAGIPEAVRFSLASNQLAERNVAANP